MDAPVGLVYGVLVGVDNCVNPVAKEHTNEGKKQTPYRPAHAIALDELLAFRLQ
jgi:hypothetical protein